MVVLATKLEIQSAQTSRLPQNAYKLVAGNSAADRCHPHYRPRQYASSTQSLEGQRLDSTSFGHVNFTYTPGLLHPTADSRTCTLSLSTIMFSQMWMEQVQPLRRAGLPPRDVPRPPRNVKRAGFRRPGSGFSKRPIRS